ncbi:MAG: AAA family ATPase [Verrucomicrobiales bacterium]
MIRKLTFSNFCSFADEATLNFTTSAKTPTDNSFVETTVGDQVSVLAGVFGPNGSGKTTLLKAMTFTQFFLIFSYKGLADDEQIPLDTFLTRTKEKSEFDLDFEGRGKRYRYKFTIQDKAILEERLYLYNQKTKSFRTLLHRQLSDDGELSLKQSKSFTDLALLKKLITERPNSSMLAAGLVTGKKEFKEIADCIGPQISNVGRHGKKAHGVQEMDEEIFTSSEFFHKHPEYNDDLTELLQAADLGISSFEIRKVPGIGADKQSKELYVPFLTHEGPDGSFELSIFDESSGTRRLFLLFAAFLPILKYGGLAVIDEMESDLHPHIIPLLLGLFSDRHINTLKAQLLFTCHHVEILNHLAKEQITLVDKSEDCVSDAYRLSDVKGVRRDENHFANYNAGRYDAVPEPSIF